MASNKKLTAKRAPGKPKAIRFETDKALFRAVRGWAIARLSLLPFIAEAKQAGGQRDVNGRLFGAVKRQVRWLYEQARPVKHDRAILDALGAAEQVVAAIDSYIRLASGREKTADTPAVEANRFCLRGMEHVAEPVLGTLKGSIDWLGSLLPSHPGPQGWEARSHFVQSVASPLRNAQGMVHFTARSSTGAFLFARDKDRVDGGSADTPPRFATSLGVDAMDDLVALSIVAGLVSANDFRSLIASAKRGHRKYPTLTDGLEVERKRLRLTINSLTRR